MSREASFRAALLDPGAAVPAGLLDGGGRAAGRRYDVYRNNVTVALRETLAAAFPTVKLLLGDENFGHVARDYLRAEPPRSPVLADYGDGFPAALAAHPKLAHLGYLPDVARLDRMLGRAYHAADHIAADPARLQGLDEAALADVRLSLAPSLAVLASDWPVLSIHRYTHDPSQPKPRPGPQEVVVLRPGYDPEAHPLPAGGAAFLSALMSGARFAEAQAAGGAALDLGAVLALLFQTGAVAAITLPGDPPC